MKLRIRGDSIRLRLTRGEVAELLERGEVADATHFPAGPALGYRLCADPAAATVSAAFEAGTLQVRLPRATADGWGRSDEVAVRGAVPVGAGSLSILVEKDFPCPTSRPGEDDSDAFSGDRRGVKC